jgi:hypothetical protein
MRTGCHRLVNLYLPFKFKVGLSAAVCSRWLPYDLQQGLHPRKSSRAISHVNTESVPNISETACETSYVYPNFTLARLIAREHFTAQSPWKLQMIHRFVSAILVDECHVYRSRMRHTKSYRHYLESRFLPIRFINRTNTLKCSRTGGFIITWLPCKKKPLICAVLLRAHNP